MSRFEFNSVLVSIMLAFAAAELVTAWGRILRDRARFGFSLPFALLTVWLFLSLVLHWFGLWSYREVPFDHAHHSLLVLLPAMAMALLTHVLTPESSCPGPEALGRHYLDSSGVVLPLAGLFMLLATLSDLALPGVLDAAPPAYFLASGLSLAALGLTRRLAVHNAVLAVNAGTSALVMAASEL